MLFGKRKWFVLITFTTLMALAGVGCRGFFVKATVNGVTVTPSTLNLAVGGTQQLTALATFSDGSTSTNVTNSATWTSADSTHVSVSKSGVVTGVAVTTSGVTITATFNGFSGTSSVTVGQTSALTITANPSSPSLSGSGGAGVGTIQFTATSNGNDVTSTTTFTSSNSNVILMSGGSVGTLEGTGTVTISGTNSSSGATGTLSVTVNP